MVIKQQTTVTPLTRDIAGYICDQNWLTQVDLVMSLLYLVDSAHYNDVRWPSWPFKSSPAGQFVQQFVKVYLLPFLWMESTHGLPSQSDGNVKSVM